MCKQFWRRGKEFIIPIGNCNLEAISAMFFRMPRTFPNWLEQEKKNGGYPFAQLMVNAIP